MVKKFLLTYIILLGLTYAEMKQACEVVYQGDLNDLNDSSVIVPEMSVALSGIIKIISTTDGVNGASPPSIFFVIDNSASMMGASGTDGLCQRFAISSWFIDTLMTIYPKAEVGLSIFNGGLYIDPTDDTLFVKCPGYELGGYLPLLKLNQHYGQETGQEVINKYLEIQTGSMFATLVYVPSNPAIGANAGTNINAGFTCAKHAFTNSIYKKTERHFVIFLSDGEANVASGPETDPAAYVTKVDGIPTTFTVFFTASGQAPTSLINFTNNVKTNGYSKINDKSNIWSIQANRLKQLLIENVMTIIFSSTSMSPDTITLNGLVNNTYDTLNQIFTFNNPFPLLGVSTDFKYGVDYTVEKDSVDTASGDTIHTVYDTSISGEFAVKIQNGAPLPTHYPDTFRLDCWEREIVFYYNNNQINFVNETMTPITVRFNYNPGIAKYDYTNASAKLEITNTSGISRDKETIILTKNGNTFTGTFPRVLLQNSASPTQGDGILQHYSTDNIVATFRNNENPKLPLDTLVSQIPFNFGGIIVIDSGFYYDNNANGYIDSIYVAATNNIAGGLTNTHIKELLDSAITLPAFRNFIINSYGITQGGFYIRVVEATSHTPVTYTTTNDRITVKEYILSAGGKVAAGNPRIYDRIAPIIHWDPRSALLRDYRVSSKSDTLGVKFSEPVKSVSSDEPFYFLNHTNNSNYVVKLSAAGHPQPDSLVFHVASVAGTMQDGDSLWIHEANRIADDTAGNFQNNTLNIKRRLYVDVLYGPITIECGYYYDNNADGYVDSIYVKATTEIEGGLTNNHIAEIVDKAITLPAFRGFTVGGSGVVTGGFFIKVTENKGHNPITYITNDDKLIVSTYKLSMGGEVVGGTLPVYDRVAPLIHWEARAAYLIDFMDPAIADTLFIKFSEPVNRVTAIEPFYFLDKDNNTNYTVTLSDVGQPETDKMVFSVTSVSGVDYMEDGDSVWIKETDRVCDDRGNFQNNNQNARRRLYVRRIVLPYTYVPRAVSPISVQSLTTTDNRVPVDIVTVLGNDGILNDLNLQKNASGDYCGMIIMVVSDPDNIGQFIPDLKIRGTLTMLDAVGNTLVLKANLAWWDQRKSLVWVWNLKNRNGRVVGSGMYVCLFEIEDITPSLGYDNRPQKQVKKITIGVK